MSSSSSNSITPAKPNVKYKWKCCWDEHKYDFDEKDLEKELPTVTFDLGYEKLICRAQSKVIFKTPRAAAIAGEKHDAEHNEHGDNFYDGIKRDKFTIVVQYVNGKWKRIIGSTRDLLDYDRLNEEGKEGQ